MSSDDVKDKLEKLEGRIEDHEKRISLIEGEAKSVEVASAKPLSLPEFMRGRNTQYHKDKILCIAYFLEKHRGQASFTVQDLDKAYSTCGYKKPANMSDIVAKTASQGLLMEVGEEDGLTAWTLTRTGERVVEEDSENEGGSRKPD